MKRTSTLVNLRRILLPVAIVFLAKGSGAAQTLSRDRVQLALTSQVCKPSKEVSCGADLRAVDAALRSPSKLWTFITASETGYFERVAGASSAGKLMPAKWIPTILSANRELAREAFIHKFGVQRYPLDQAGPYFQKTPRISPEKAEALGLEALQKQFDDAVGRSAFFQRQPYALLLASARTVLSSDFRKRHSAQDQANDANLLRYAWDRTKPIPANLGPTRRPISGWLTTLLFGLSKTSRPWRGLHVWNGSRSTRLIERCQRSGPVVQR